jgi:hypothetical protein
MEKNKMPNLTVEVPLGEVIKCENCGGTMFRPVMVLRKVSKIALTMPNDGLMQIPVFRCDDCNAPNLNLIPHGAGTPEELFGTNNKDINE